MAQIKKINIKGVEYDLAGSGSSTTDTAYVDNKTLYIEEGTTAGGGTSSAGYSGSVNFRPELLVHYTNGTIQYLKTEDYTESPTLLSNVQYLEMFDTPTSGMSIYYEGITEVIRGRFVSQAALVDNSVALVGKEYRLLIPTQDNFQISVAYAPF